MSKALSRKFRDLDDDARDYARAEARRSGKRLGEWLDDVIRESAEADAEEEDWELDEGDRVEAIARRLARSGASRNERRPDRDDYRQPRRWRDEAQELRAAPRRRREAEFDDDDSRREPPPRDRRDERETELSEFRRRRMREERLDPQAIVADAAAIVGRRIAESERHTARALDNLAGLLEDGRRGRETAEEGFAFLAKRLGRIESRLVNEPAAADSVRPIRSALGRLETRLERLSGSERVAEVGRALDALDRRLAELDRRLEAEPHGREPHRRYDREGASTGGNISGGAFTASEPVARRAESSPRRPLDDAIAEITRRQRVLDEAAAPPSPAPSRSTPAPDPWADVPPAKRFAAVHGSLDSISEQLETVRQTSVERADQQLVVMRQIESLRRDIEEMSQAIGSLAPRASIAAIDTALRDLAQRVETQRGRGVADDLLAPAERIAAEVRAVIKELDPSPIVRNLHADVLKIGSRLDALQKPDGAAAVQVEQLAVQTSEIREQLAELAARPLPLEKIETRLVDLSQRVDALARVRAGAAKAALAFDMGEVARNISSIVSTETSANLGTFNRRLEQLAAKLDEAVVNAGGKRIDDLGKRIDELGQRLTKRIDASAAQKSLETGPLEKLVSGLAKKIDTALDAKPHAPALEEIGRKIEQLETRLPDPGPGFESIARIEAMLAKPAADQHFAELAKRIDGVRETLAQRISQGDALPQAVDVGSIEALVRSLDRKIETALAAGVVAPDMEPIREQLEQLSLKVERLEDPSSHPTLGALLACPPHNPQLADISRRLEDMQAALAQRAMEGSRVEARQNELTELVEQLAARMDQAIDPRGDAEALKALENQIGALSQRLDRNAQSGASLAAVEARIGALVAQIEETRTATTLVAEDAVRRATQELIHQATPAPGALREALERELTEIRNIQDESGQRTHETLLAVHETLERVVDRLATFEDEIVEIRSVATAPVAVQSKPMETPWSAARAPEPAVEPRRTSRVETSDEDDMADFLMPPGARHQRREPGFGSAPASEGGARSEAAQMDFIAAARRAAQQAALDADAAEKAQQARRAARAESPAGHAERAPGRWTGGLAATIQDRKRPLLLGLGALVLMIGAYQIARVGIEGAESWREGRHHAGDAPVDEAASVDAAAPVATPPVAAPDLPKAPGVNRTAPPPRMIAPGAENAPLDKTPVGSIGGPGVNSLSSTDVIGVIKSLAERGKPAAQFELAVRLLEGRGLPRDAKAAAQWLEKAAAQGLAPAQYRLASAYEKGVGVERDYARARKWYQSAAEAGHARAMHNLAVLLAEGSDGGKPDYAAAAEWFRKGGELGVRDSQYNLAILYARGLGVGQSLVQSYVWFSAAAAQGDVDAGKKRDEVSARLDSKELATAKALVAGFRVREPLRDVNEVSPPNGGWENGRDPNAAAPPPKPASKAKISAI